MKTCIKNYKITDIFQYKKLVASDLIALDLKDNFLLKLIPLLNSQFRPKDHVGRCPT